MNEVGHNSMLPSAIMALYLFFKDNLNTKCLKQVLLALKKGSAANNCPWARGWAPLTYVINLPKQLR
jgi:hypothetical protein